MNCGDDCYAIKGGRNEEGARMGISAENVITVSYTHLEIKHLFRMMRNTLLALFVLAGTAFATESYSQTIRVTVVANNMSTGKVISEIAKQTDYLFVYNVNEVNLKRNVKVNAKNKSVAEVLNKVCLLYTSRCV